MECRFGEFTLDPTSGDLRRAGRPVELQPKVAQFLAMLVERPGELVPRDLVAAALWPDVLVTDQSLRQVVHKARLALGDDPKAPRFIATLSGRGFRFLGELGPPARPEGRWPAETDAFVGRGRELALLADLAAGSRSIVLLGPAGAGKTRLLVRFGASAGVFPGGAWFCDLTEARVATAFVHAVADGLRIDLGREDPLVQLGNAISARGRCLVGLDNCEQAAEIVAEAVARWRAMAPEATFVLTSRERIDAVGEIEVEPLDHPDAVALFEARARSVSPGFSVDAANRAEVEALVAELDHLPLAIELAAARIRVLGAAGARARLADRFRLLTGGRGRHETLRGAIDWSWGLLTPWEQAALAQCSVFTGGFSLEAAEAVLDLAAWPEAPWVVDVLQALIAQSLLRGAGDPPWFGMLASLHDYAAEKLAADPEAAESAARRHGAYCASLRGVVASLDTVDGAAAQRALHRALPNLVVACERAVARQDAPTAAATCEAAWAALELCGPFAAGVALADRVLALALPDGSRAAMARIAGRSRHLCGRMAEAPAFYELALALYQRLGDRRGEGVVLGYVAIARAEQGRVPEALACFEAALAAHREGGDGRAEGRVRGSIGLCHEELGRPDLAIEAIEGALALHRELGDRRSEGFALGNLGAVYLGIGRPDDAARYAEAALAVDREVGDRRFEAMALTTLGAIRLAQGSLSAARSLLDAAIAASREVGNRRQEGIARGLLGAVHVETGDVVAAGAELASALATHRIVRNRRYEAAVLASLAKLEAALGRPATNG